MSPFHHEFFPGFNVWYVVAIIGVVLVALAGWHKYYVKEGGGVRRRYNNRFTDLIVMAMTVVVGMMVCSESMHGIVQMLDNTLSANDDPIWSVLCAPIVILCVVVFYHVLLTMVCRFAVNLKKRTLVRLKKER